MTEETITPQGEPEGQTAPVVTEEANEQDTANDLNSETKPEDFAPKGEKTGKAKDKDWHIGVITALRDDLRKSEQEKEELRQKIANPNASTENKTAPENLTDAEINRRAAIIAANNKFNEACDNTYQEGKKTFSDFDNALENLRAVGALGTNVNPIFLQTVTELPNAHKLLHHLGNNPQEAARINSLAPLKMAIELARIEGSLGATKIRPVSNAPAPIMQVNGTGKSDLDLSDPNLDMKKFSELRQKQRAERAKSQ
jgi:hypothetical protein